MRTKTMLIVGLVLLWLPGVLWSMEESPARDTPYMRLSGRGMQEEGPPAAERVMRIYQLRYYPAGQLADIIRTVSPKSDVTVVPDERQNRLIVTATKARMQQIEELVATLDTATVREEQAQQMMCRVYMLELPPKDQNLKPFSLTIESVEQLPATQFFKAIDSTDLQIDSFHQGSELAQSGHIVLTIQGRAVSNEAVRSMLEQIPNVLMNELRWEDDTLTPAIPAAQVTQLPAALQEHIRKLLGEGVRTVGYWFGNLSIPGEVRAPIGAWEFELNVEPDQNDELRFRIEVMQESQDAGRIILSNSLRGKVGKPIIIGYNRDRYGVRTMGAMVIVPEVETSSAGSGGRTRNR